MILFNHLHTISDTPVPASHTRFRGRLYSQFAPPATTYLMGFVPSLVTLRSAVAIVCVDFITILLAMSVYSMTLRVQNVRLAILMTSSQNVVQQLLLHRAQILPVCRDIIIPVARLGIAMIGKLLCAIHLIRQQGLLLKFVKYLPWTWVAAACQTMVGNVRIRDNMALRGLVKRPVVNG